MYIHSSLSTILGDMIEQVQLERCSRKKQVYKVFLVFYSLGDQLPLAIIRLQYQVEKCEHFL